MIPEQRPSTTVVQGEWLNPPAARPVVSYHWGPVALNDPTQGLLVQLWTARLTGDADDTVTVSASNTAPVDLFTRPMEVKEVSLAFDQNGQPHVAFVQEDGSSWLWWYDTVSEAMVFTELDSEVITPRITLDDARTAQNGVNDVILMYVRSGSIYYRQQRDRFTIEYFLQNNAQALYHVSMSTLLRLQWTYKGPGQPNPPYLADVVLDLCQRAGLPPGSVDVSELYNDIVPGMKVAVDEGLDKPIDWLREIFFFDKAEYDRQIHFPKRGRQVVARIPYKHLVEGSPKALKQELADEKKLPRLVNINHLDPDAGHAKNKQTAERRSNLIQTDVKKNIESQVVLTVDQAATAAMVRLKVYHNELVEYEFSTTLMYAHLTTTDVVEVEDSEGDWHRMRLVEKNEDSGVIEWEGVQDAGSLVYATQRTGNSLPPPISTTPGLISETQIEIINSSPFRDQDDELGVYIAASGESSAWTGYQLLYSIDNGTSYIEAFRGETPSTIGLTDTDLLEEISAEYQADQTVEVTVNYPLSSVSYDQLLQGQNRICIGDEILQFETATMLGMDGVKYRYELSGLVRGRYNTEPLHWPAGTRFVMIDESLVFAQVQRSMIGADIMYKPVSFGLSEDETAPTAYLFDEPFSQIEWPVTNVQASRDGSDNVTVSCIGRARLGVDTHPYHSKYFRGYRYKFSDDHVIDSTSESVTRASTPIGLTVQVCALNEITGEGPYSTPVST